MQLREKDPFQATNNNFFNKPSYLCISNHFRTVAICICFMIGAVYGWVSYYFSYPCNWSG